MRGRGAGGYHDARLATRRALLAVLFLALACPAVAQDKKKRRPAAPPPGPAAEAPPKPALPLPVVPPPQMRSAVRSASSRSVVVGRSTTAQCRAQCSERRVICLGNPEDTSSCGSQWTQCLSDCAGLGYSRAQPR